MPTSFIEADQFLYFNRVPFIIQAIKYLHIYDFMLCFKAKLGIGKSAQLLAIKERRN